MKRQVIRVEPLSTFLERWAVYSRYFPENPPARIFVCVPAWPGHFDVEVDCIAAV
jgi:enamine deaminase RidA (YjgF/YER057c/UK114 family)